MRRFALPPLLPDTVAAAHVNIRSACNPISGALPRRGLFNTVPYGPISGTQPRRGLFNNTMRYDPISGSQPSRDRHARKCHWFPACAT